MERVNEFHLKEPPKLTVESRQEYYLGGEDVAEGDIVLSRGCLADVQHFIGQLEAQRHEETKNKGLGVVDAAWGSRMGDGVTAPTWDIRQGDALMLLRAMPSESVDYAYADPPYNVGKAFDGDISRDRREDYLPWLWSIFAELGRVVRVGAFLAFSNRIRLLNNAFCPPVPWSFFHILVWHKPLSLSATFYGLAPHWEPVIVWVKGKPWRPFRGPDVLGDVLSVNVVAGPRRNGAAEHPTVKPVELMARLIQHFCRDGGTVLDPFSGTGSTGIAAIRTGRSYVGLELSAKYVELSKRRLSLEAPQANSIALAHELGRELQLPLS